MIDPVQDLVEWSEKLKRFADAFETMPETTTLNAIWKKATELGKSSSKSWLGYHANVYYKNFQTPPAGVH